MGWKYEMEEKLQKMTPKYVVDWRIDNLEKQLRYEIKTLKDEEVVALRRELYDLKKKVEAVIEKPKRIKTYLITMTNGVVVEVHATSFLTKEIVTTFHMDNDFVYQISNDKIESIKLQEGF